MQFCTPAPHLASKRALKSPPKIKLSYGSLAAGAFMNVFDGAGSVESEVFNDGVGGWGDCVRFSIFLMSPKVKMSNSWRSSCWNSVSSSFEIWF